MSFAASATTLVTGAGGFLGSHVARQLVARGDSVRVLLRPSSSNRAIADLSLEYVTGDLRDAASLDRAMTGIRHVYHVAADYRLWAKNPQDIYDSNVGGTKNLLTAAKNAGIELLIYTSTVATIAPLLLPRKILNQAATARRCPTSLLKPNSRK
jgi:dihydroflavonol-4-reductase